MSDSTRTLLFLGPDQETQPSVRALSAKGFEVLAFADFEEFMAHVLSGTPVGVVLWDSTPQEDLRTAIGLVRHHFRSRRCVVVLVCGPDSPVSEPDCPMCIRIASPADPVRLAEVLEESDDAKANGSAVPRILVVDDDANIVMLGSHIVSGLGMVPIVAFDGEEAVDKAQRLVPDLVLLDINMPHMDGFQVIEALKEDLNTRMIPIIVFSARKSEEDKVRALKMGADDYVTKPFSITELSARIDRLLSRIRTGVSASSTTGLPGSVSVEQVLVERIRSRVPLAVLYLDADHFKAFNDCYGFSRGDSVIRQTGDIILETVRQLGRPEDFVGHIGGDDFIAITSPDRAEGIAKTIIARFDRIIPYYYDPKDRRRGAIHTENRKGRRTRFPLMSISIAIVTNTSRPFNHAGEVADVAVQLKKFAKAQKGSVWVVDQRSETIN